MPHDPSLALPTAALPAPDLAGPSDALAFAGPARPRPFLLAAPGCSARGVETRALEGVEQEGRLLLGRLGLAGSAGGNVLLAPAQARREMVGGDGSWMETLLVTSDGLAAQWAPTHGGSAALARIRIELDLPAQIWRADGPFLRADAADGVRLLQVVPAPTWSLRPSGGGLAVAADVALGAGGAARLLAASGADRAQAEARLTRLARARETRAESDLAALRTRRLATRTGVSELDDGLAWAAARVDAAAGIASDAVHELALGEPIPLDPDSRRAWTALGALASGSGGRGPVDATSPLGALARARAAAWRGVRLTAADLPAWASADAGELNGSAHGVATRAALFALADAVEPWAGKERAEALRVRARIQAAAPNATRAGARRLPTLGASALAPAGDPLAAALAAALELPGQPPYAPPLEDPPEGVARALTAWACLNAGALERGFALFRRHLTDGFAHGVGLWPDGRRIHDPAGAALVPLVFLDGLLGARADAHYGRLRLAPRLPPHWTRLTVTGITIGDAEVTMDYEAVGGAHRFRIEQRSGAVPLMLIFEPILAVALGAPVRIDGEPADVAVAPTGGRAQARVQLPLDRMREIWVG